MGTEGGNQSILSWFSRKMRAAIVFYTGRNYLPVPFRQPLKMCIGAPIHVDRAYPNPTEEQIDELQKKIIDAVTKLYEENRPEWETKELMIT
mmetsp:Transcript_3674/g.5683  ORF Transcript_3674/g.5683 Transcript_3674/m.5683 type:complete len:92 (+) Transcript_3674:882-1157(+)